MINGQHNGNIALGVVPTRSSGAWVSSQVSAPVQICHLAVLALPDPEQPGLDRVVLAPYDHLHGARSQALLVGWPTSHPSYGAAQQAAHESEPERHRQGEPGGDPAELHRRGDGRSVRPLVLHAAVGDTIELHVTNLLPTLRVSLGLIDDGLGMQLGTGQPAAAFGDTQVCKLHCPQPGVFPLFNRAGVDDAHFRCLLGVLMVEA